MQHYEIVFLVHPDQSEQVPAMIERYRSTIETSGGQIHRLEARLAFGQDQNQFEALNAGDHRQGDNQANLTQDHRDIDGDELPNTSRAVDASTVVDALRDTGQTGVVDQNLEPADKRETNHGDRQQCRVRIGQPATLPGR